MRYSPLKSDFYQSNRANLAKHMLPNSLAVVNANDVLPINGDAVTRLFPGSDLYYLTGVEQEESILVLYPDADDEKQRELLFLRETNETIATWEGHKLTKEQARERTGIKHIHWTSEFPRMFHRLMCECEHVYLNSNEHKRSEIVVETREARFVRDTIKKYPLHDFHRLARVLHRLRAVKAPQEVEMLKKACAITEAGFRRVCKFVKPGVNECEVEAEFAHEFMRAGGNFAYTPIVASGRNSCVLHYIENDQPCRRGDVLLLDVAASYGNYNSDLTRTIPVSGRFSKRQRQVYNAVLRVMRVSSQNLTAGKTPKEWQKEAEQMMEKELVDLGLLTMRKIKRQDPEKPAFKEFFMHGLGHPLGLEVHDVGITTEPMQNGWLMTVEPGIYIPKEKLGVRLENDVLITERGPVDLMASIPVEADDVEALMNS